MNGNALFSIFLGIDRWEVVVGITTTGSELKPVLTGMVKAFG
jgi:hypothetical protein